MHDTNQIRFIRHRRPLVNIRRATSAVVSVWISLFLCSPILGASVLPPADEVLDELQISGSDQESIRQGNIVKWTASEGSDRELAVGMAFLVKTKPDNLVELFRDATALKMESVITAHGRIAGDGAPDDFARVSLEPNGEKEAKRYLEAEPGEELNLNAKEITAFQALKSTGEDGSPPVKEVEALVRQTLLSRYQAYRAKGLSGITPYERKHGQQVSASDELSRSTQQMTLVAKYLPSFYAVLLKYPARETTQRKDIEEHFYWINMDLFGRPTYVLSHRMLFRIGEAYVTSDRHFYASHEYNSLQQAVAALPTKDGTVVIYLGRVSTDQVAGFGSSLKHPVSRAIMGPYIKDLFEALRAKAEKQ